MGRKSTLFKTFLKIGAFTFGGGYAMIPLIQHEVAEKRKWITDDDILDIVAIAESTPGPIAINTATFVGYKTAGFWGSFLATTGVVLPAFLIIIALSFVLDKFQHLQAVQFAFNGIRVAVLGLVLKAFYTMYKKCPKNPVSYIIAALAFIFAAFFDINVLIIIIGCAVVGLVTALIAERRKDI